MAVGGWRLAVGGWRLAVGGWRLAVGGWRLAVGGCLLGALSGVWAQGLPDPSPELQRQERQRHELRQHLEAQPWSPGASTEPEVTPQQLPEETPCVSIERVQLQGVLVSDALQSALGGPNGSDSPVGRCLGEQGITLLIQRVQQALVEQGYITSQVQVPEQALEAGVLVLQLEEGRVARLRTEPEDAPSIQGAWALREGQILNLRDIEQTSENLQRLPSLHSTIQIEPSQDLGTSNVVVRMQTQRPWRAGLTLDNSGNHSTGKLQGNATLSWDNPLGLADLFYISLGRAVGNKDSGPRGSDNHMLHYSLPWGYWLLGLTLSNSSYMQTVVGPFESYAYSGTSSQRELSLQRVLQRSGVSKTTASLKGFVRQYNNHIGDLEVLVQRRRTAGWEARIEHLHYLQESTFNGSLAYKRGTGAFNAQPNPEAQSNDHSVKRLHAMNGVLGWSKPFTLAKQAWQYNSQLQWQWNQSDMAPQDVFCLGGRGTVRGVDSQHTVCGDRGQLWRQELSTAVPPLFLLNPDTQMYLALDAGRTTTPDIDDGHYSRLSGFALGLRGQNLMGLDNPVQWDVFVGAPWHTPEGFTAPAYTVGFNLRTDF